MRPHNPLRRHTLLHPVHHRPQPVDTRTPRPARAVKHPRHHIQPVKIPRLRVAHLFAHPLVIGDRRIRIHLLIRPPRVMHNLPAPLPQRLQILVQRIHIPPRLHRPRRIPVKIKHRKLPLRPRRRIQHVELHLALPTRQHRLVRSNKVIRPKTLTPHRLPRHQQLALTIPYTPINPSNSANLRRRKAPRPIGPRALRQVPRGIETTLPRIVNHPIGQPIHRIALLINNLVQQRQLLHRQRRIAQLPLPNPNPPHHIPRQKHPRRADHQPVKILRIPLRLLHPLPPARRTAHPVGILRPRPVISPNHILRQHRRLMHGQIGKVDQLPPPVRILRRHPRERCQRLLRRVMPRIGRRRREPILHRPVHRPHADRPRRPPIAHHLKPLVPIGRQLNRKPCLRPDHPAHIAMRRQLLGSRHRPRRSNLNLLPKRPPAKRLARHHRSTGHHHTRQKAQQK